MRIDASMATSMERISSGQRINQAADDAAGLAISEKLQTQERGLNQANRNLEDMQSLANTAEGALSSLHDNLQRMRQLAVQASGGMLTESDRGLIQQEIDQLKQGMADTVRNTEFNTIRVLDGTFDGRQVAGDAQGRGMTMTIENAGLEALGIADFDVTGTFDLARLDEAIEHVSGARSSVGAMTNRMDHAMAGNAIAQQNQAAANSRIRDADLAQQMMNLSRDRALQQYQVYAQRQQMEQMGMQLNLLFG